MIKTKTIALFCLIFVAAIFADDKLRLLKSDLMEQVQLRDGTVKIVSGSVHFNKGDVDLFCDRAYWYDFKEEIEFYGNVRVTHDSRILTADSLIYYYAEDRILTKGQPMVVDSSRTITAAEMEYWTESNIVEAKGKVHYTADDNELLAQNLTYYADSSKTIASTQCRFIDRKDNNILQSDSILYYNEKEKLHAFIDPVLTKSDSTGQEIYRIEGNIISGNNRERAFLSIGNVRIFQDSITAYADSANYNDSAGTVRLTGNPKVVNQKQDLQGDEIQAGLVDGKIQHIYIIGRAITTAISMAYLPIPKADTLKAFPDSVEVRDEMTGKLMEIYFEKGKIDSIRVSGMATSFYNVKDDSILQGTNSASGDTVIMKFYEKALGKISIIGGTKGEFVPHSTNESMDTSVIYAAERIDYHVTDRKTDLLKNASVHYQDAELKAGKIEVHWDDNLLFAFPEDPSRSDSVDASWPTMTQKGREPFTGKEVVYNIKTQRGRIFDGRTHMDDGYYYGENIKKKGKKTFYIDDGTFTTCDAEHPHFYFQSKKMKMIQKDKIFARPIVMYIHDIPLLALPFAVIPNKGGNRRSGWIMPTYGNNSNVGNYLRGLGYFWATNDYTDFKLTTDFFDEKGVRFNLTNRYKLRYHLDGRIQLSYHNMAWQTSPEKIYQVSIDHNHKISPTASFRASGKFVSNDQYLRKNGLDLEDRLNQQMISNATYSKSWRNTPYGMSANASQTINLQAKVKKEETPTRDGNKIAYINRTFPSVSFRRSTERLVPLRSSQSASEARWYNEIRYSVNSRIINKQDIYYQSEVTNADSLWLEKNEMKNGVQNSISVNSSQKLLSYFSLTQNMNLSEDWIFEMEKPLYDETGQVVLVDNQVRTVTRTGFFPRHTGSMSLGLNTKIYGLFPIKIGSLRAIRHVLTPSVDLSYRPDFTQKIFGWDPEYVTPYLDTNKVKRKYDPFASTLIGSTPSGESKTMSISLRNSFQSKTEKDGEEKKLDLLTMNISTSHNFAADSMKWSPLRTSLRTKLKNLDMDISMTHDPYKYNKVWNRREDQWNKTFYGIPVPRMTQVSASTGISIKSTDFGGQLSTQEDTLQNTPDEESRGGLAGGSGQKSSGLWSANMTFRYSLSKINPLSKDENFTMNLNAKLNLTKNWNISYTASMDLIKRTLYGQRFSVERDLHCWEYSFSYVPTGYGKQWTFLIRAKAPVLRDLKHEERGGRSRSAYY
ncbi:MAG: hypothetical protein JXQ65_01745 [Candidatus Marinimicrobia bacterium]|nr:hypothetical protein [Candidatus Neomarinimicrobiota bacterium]